MSAEAGGAQSGRRRAGRTAGALVAALGFALAFGQAEGLLAGSFSVNPARILLSSKARSALVSLGNQTGEVSNVEISVMAWSEDADGKPKLEPSSDLVVLPSIMSLPPHGAKNLRIALRQREVAGIERSYRLMIKEMPPSRASQTGTAVRLVVNLAIPVYVQPPRPSGTVMADGLELVHGHVRVHLIHQGNAHATLEAATLVGRSANGQERFTRRLDAWGLLAGARRDLHVPLTPDECRQSTVLELRLRQNGKDSARTLTVDATSCTD